MIIANFFKKLVLTSTFSVFVVVTASAMCDPCPPGWTCIADVCTPPGSAEVPIDSGVFSLLVIGAVYGAKKIYDQRKPK